MPYLSHITSTFFTNLINRLGVRPPPPDGFDLINTVQPVSIVDSDITLSAVTSTLLLDTPFTAGEQAAPAADTVLADTGAQAAGNYFARISWSATDGLNAVGIKIQRRNAANAANIWEDRINVPNGQSADGESNIRLVLQTNERLRVTSNTVAGAGSKYNGLIFLAPSA